MACIAEADSRPGSTRNPRAPDSTAGRDAGQATSSPPVQGASLGQMLIDEGGDGTRVKNSTIRSVQKTGQTDRLGGGSRVRCWTRRARCRVRRAVDLPDDPDEHDALLQHLVRLSTCGDDDPDGLYLDCAGFAVGPHLPAATTDHDLAEARIGRTEPVPAIYRSNPICRE